MSFHDELGVGDIHIPYNWQYADATARNAATGFISTDIGKFARQLDDNSMWMLVATTPTWVLAVTGIAADTSRVLVPALKATAGSISKGQTVYIAGYDVGQAMITVELAQANAGGTMPVIGVADEAITDVAFGRVALLGKISGVDTSSLSVNAALYASASVAGALTSTRPVGATDLIQRVARVAYVDVSTGAIEVVGPGLEEGLPNLDQDKVWLGDANNHPQEVDFVAENLGAVSVDVSAALRPDGTGGVTFADVAHADTTGQTVDDHHNRDHRATHISGGADAFLTTDFLEAIVKRLRESGGPTDLLVGAIPDVTKLVRSGSSIIGDVWGTWFQQASSDAESSFTGATTYQQKLRLTTPALPAGTYRIGWSAEWSFSADNQLMGIQVQIDDVTTIAENRVAPQARSGGFTPKPYYPTSGFAHAVLTAGAHDIDLDYATVTNAGQTAFIRNAKLEIWRVA